MVLLKESPWKGVIILWKRGKLGPRFVRPSRVVARVCKVAYRLDLPKEFFLIYSTFHVSQLLKCVANDFFMVPMDDIQVTKRLNYMERSVAILDKRKKDLAQLRGAFGNGLAAS